MHDVQSTAVSVRQRLDTIDLVRGVVMILMLLDHTRDFTHAGALITDPLNPAVTTPMLYLTRWITHLCAPTFVLLAGLSVGLKAMRGASAGELAHTLWTRGLWLVFLEFAVFRLSIWPSLDPSLLVHLQVIWAIGMSMIVLAGLVRMRVPLAVIATIGVIIVAGHNALDTVTVPPWRGPGSPVPGVVAKIWMLLHQGGFFPIAGFPSPIVWANYPVLPWIGILCLGYAMSQLYAWPAEQRRRTLVLMSIAMVAVFLVLRGFNLYGDLVPWTPRGDVIKSAMALFNVTKYPPSLSFTLITLAPTLLALGLLDGRAFPTGPLAAAVTFGRVPFFFYLLQWPTAHLAGLIVNAALGKDLAPLFMHPLQLFTLPKPPDIGGPLWTTYVCWIAGVLLLYWPCRWFARVKAQRRDWYLSYL